MLVVAVVVAVVVALQLGCPRLLVVALEEVLLLLLVCSNSDRLRMFHHLQWRQMQVLQLQLHT